MSNDVQIMDFSPRAAAIQFTLYGDAYYACTDMPLGMMQKLSGIRDTIRTTIDGTESFDMEPMLQLFDELLLDESAARFRAGTTNKEKMIGISVIMNIIPWLMEEYGLRPTQQLDPSSTGSGGGEIGTPSTDGALPETLTSS